jgi:hypothetical protein
MEAVVSSTLRPFIPEEIAPSMNGMGVLVRIKAGLDAVREGKGLAPPVIEPRSYSP